MEDGITVRITLSIVRMFLVSRNLIVFVTLTTKLFVGIDFVIRRSDPADAVGVTFPCLLDRNLDCRCIIGSFH